MSIHLCNACILKISNKYISITVRNYILSKISISNHGIGSTSTAFVTVVSSKSFALISFSNFIPNGFLHVVHSSPSVARNWWFFKPQTLL